MHGVDIYKTICILFLATLFKKNCINTSIYLSQVSRLCTNFHGLCFGLSCGNNLLRNPRTELWKLWVTVIY